MNPHPLLVACLCAAWCGSCRDYVAVFDELSARLGAAAHFTWIDIEDEADQLDTLDIDDFPTVLIARGGEVVFFGPITPQPQTLARLVESAQAGELRQADVPDAVAALARRLCV
jgi:thiol-disulfide isomerase/thioredoxin